MKYAKFFTTSLMEWNKYENKRQMPWKGEKDPYKIWISEIILQQTKVGQGLDYYNRFLQAYPTVHHILADKESNIFKLWEGLGYYSRCRNIITSAKYISEKLNGKFPETFDDIIQLKGIGNYTASAIASFAFNLPYAVVDGNVFRVLSRFFGLKIPIDNTDGKKTYSRMADDLLDKKNPATYNQAIMDFGAIICKPKLPLCEICPVQSKCIAYKKNMISFLPIKEKKIIRKARWFYYLVIEYQNQFYIRRRSEKDIWQNLYEFVLIEAEKYLAEGEIIKSQIFKNIFNLKKYKIVGISPVQKQQLTHQTIYGCFFQIQIDSTASLKDYELVSKEQLDLLPFPKFISSYLQTLKNVSLNLSVSD